MRRSQSARKAIYALVVLVIFMAVLRLSRPASSNFMPAEPVTEPRVVYHNEAPKPNDVDARAQQHLDHAEPAVPPLDSKGGELGNFKEGEKVAEQHEAPPPYDAAPLYQQIVHSDAAPPVVIFSKSYCPHSMRAKKLLLEAYSIKPAPKVVELDQISHGAELQSYIKDITGRGTVPNILINGVSRGGASDMVDLGEELAAKFREWGNNKFTITKEAAVLE